MKGILKAVLEKNTLLVLPMGSDQECRVTCSDIEYCEFKTAMEDDNEATIILYYDDNNNMISAGDENGIF